MELEQCQGIFDPYTCDKGNKTRLQTLANKHPLLIISSFSIEHERIVPGHLLMFRVIQSN